MFEKLGHAISECWTLCSSRLSPQSISIWSEAYRLKLGEKCFLRGEFDRAHRFYSSITEDIPLRRKATLQQQWMQFQQGDYVNGWPEYPGNAAFAERSVAPSPNRSGLEKDQAVRVKKSNFPIELETDLGLAPWEPERSEKTPLLVWFNFGNSFGGELLCGQLIPSFQTVVSRPLILAVSPRHVDLLRSSFPDCEIVDKTTELSSPLRQCKQYVLAREMAAHVIHRDEDFKGVSPCCMTPSFTSPLHEKLLHLPAPDIGISWKTTNTDQGRYRNPPLEELAAILAKHPATYHAVQHGDIEEDQKVLKDVLGDRIRFDTLNPKGDSNQLGAELTELTALVTIDNSQLHVAGAVGVRTVAMLSIPCYWAWPESGSWSRWYDSVQLIHQQTPRSWRTAFQELDQALRAVISDHTASST